LAQDLRVRARSCLCGHYRPLNPQIIYHPVARHDRDRPQV